MLRSFDPIRTYGLTLARESSHALSNGIILAKRSSLFIQIWLEAYITFNPSQWGEHSVIMAQNLFSLFPHLVHVEESKLLTPPYGERYVLFKSGAFDWKNNYAVHVWKKPGTIPSHILETIPSHPREMQSLNNSLGDIMRFMYSTPFI